MPMESDGAERKGSSSANKPEKSNQHEGGTASPRIERGKSKGGAGTPLAKLSTTDLRSPKSQMTQRTLSLPSVQMLTPSLQRKELARKKRYDEIASRLDKEVWYRGLLGRSDMGELCKKKGDFVVRITEIKGRPHFAITIGVGGGGGPKHFVIQESAGGFFFETEKFKSIADLVNHYWKKKIPLGKGDTAIYLVNPVVRSNWEIAHEQLKVGAKIGSGAFGDVCLATLRRDGTETTVAVKTCKKQQLRKEEQEKFLKEARLMRDYHHPNIIALIGVAAEQEPLMIVLEYAPLGSLEQYLRKQAGKIGAAEREGFCRDAARGMRYLESRPTPVIHRDLAARNCLLGANKEVKITDFGLSRDTNVYSLHGARLVPVRWCAPETLRQGKYHAPSDRWSFGVLMWEIYSNAQEPYPGMTVKEVQNKLLKEKYRMEPPAGMPPKMAAIMRACWTEEYRKRPKFAVIVRQMENNNS